MIFQTLACSQVESNVGQSSQGEDPDEVGEQGVQPERSSVPGWLWQEGMEIKRDRRQSMKYWLVISRTNQVSPSK